jgi:hypothetical protein
MKNYKKPKPRSPFNQLRKYLSPKEMRKVIKNTKNGRSTPHPPEAYLFPPEEVLITSFRWGYTPEGIKYWMSIYDRLISISKSCKQSP